MQESRDWTLTLTVSSVGARTCTGRCLWYQLNVGIEQATPAEEATAGQLLLPLAKKSFSLRSRHPQTVFSHPLGSSLYFTAQAAAVLLTNTDLGSCSSPFRTLLRCKSLNSISTTQPTEDGTATHLPHRETRCLRRRGLLRYMKRNMCCGQYYAYKRTSLSITQSASPSPTLQARLDTKQLSIGVP